MGSYLPNTEDQQREMLEECGYRDYGELFSCVPDSVKLGRRLEIPEGGPELTVRRQICLLYTSDAADE